jgi:hypothetical protein
MSVKNGRHALISIDLWSQQAKKNNYRQPMSAFHLGSHPKIPIRHQRVGPTNFSMDSATRTNAIMTDSMDP